MKRKEARSIFFRERTEERSETKRPSSRSFAFYAIILFMVKIHVGSINQNKIQATQNVLTAQEMYRGATVVGVDVSVEEFGHPKNIEETIKGAKNRALAAYEGSDLAVGLESGLIVAPNTKTGYLETTACAIYDGHDYSVGLSPAFEWPKNVLKLILSGHDGSQAFKMAGLTDYEKVGTANGAIHMLTHGAVDRTKLNELAMAMALIQLQNPEHY